MQETPRNYIKPINTTDNIILTIYWLYYYIFQANVYLALLLPHYNLPLSPPPPTTVAVSGSFETRSHTNTPPDSSCLTVCLSVGMQQSGSHRKYFHDIRYEGVQPFQVWFRINPNIRDMTSHVSSRIMSLNR